MVFGVVFSFRSASGQGVPPRGGRLFGFCLTWGLFVALAPGCGGTIGGPDGSGGEGPDDEGSGGLATGGSLIGPDETGGRGGQGSGGVGSGGTPYIEEECPDEPPPPVEPPCDPMMPDVGCPTGQGCYAYLVYPYGEGCGFPTFGATCAPASTGGQGDLCGSGNYCEPGFMCVIGATAGARCTQVCSLVEPSGCPPGLVCNETDVVGYGVCF
jgi:hypothetical protein